MSLLLIYLISVLLTIAPFLYRAYDRRVRGYLQYTSPIEYILFHRSIILYTGIATALLLVETFTIILIYIVQ